MLTKVGQPLGLGRGRPVVLIAEDNRLVRLKLARLLETEAELDVLIAEDGARALELLAERPDIQICLLDWEMPGCDGLDVCRQIRATSRRHYTYVMMLTARTEREDMYEGLRAGADDYLTKPFDPVELQLKIQAAVRITSLERLLETQNRELESAYAIVAEGLEAAGRVQMGLLPERRYLADISRRLGITIRRVYEPCQTLGGDVICVAEPRGEKLAVCIADVSGHGIAAAMSAALLHSSLRSTIDLDPTPSAVLSRANRFCCEELPEEVYATAAYALIDLKAAELELCICGHPTPMLLRGNEDQAGIPVVNPPLGLFELLADDFIVHTYSLQAHDRLVLFTDGAVEARNMKGEFFSIENLADFVLRCSREENADIPNQLIAALHAWRGFGIPLEDDVSLLTLEFGQGAGAKPRAELLEQARAV